MNELKWALRVTNKYPSKVSRGQKTIFGIADIPAGEVYYDICSCGKKHRAILSER